MEKKQLQQWLNEIDKAIADEKLYSSNHALWPGSSALSSSSYSNLSRTDAFSERPKKTIEQLRQEKIEEELDQMKSPALSKKTQQLIVKSKREGKIEDRLIQEAQKKKQEASEREAKSRLEAKQKSVPLITPLAASLRREGDVVERLIDYQKVYQEKKESLKKEVEVDPGVAVPKTNKSNVESRYMKPQNKNIVVEEYSYKPEISERSTKLAAKLGESKDRLLQKPAPKAIEDAECTFTPSIIKKEDGDNKAWWENLYQQSRIIQEKKEKQKEVNEINKGKDPECTFKPKISGNSAGNPEDRVRRLQEWEKAREDRLKQFRDQNNSKGLEECTFAPKINRNIIPSQTTKQVAPTNKFLQRQYLNKQKGPDTSPRSKTPDVEFDMDPEDYSKAIRQLRQELLSIPLD